MYLVVRATDSAIRDNRVFECFCVVDPVVLKEYLAFGLRAFKLEGGLLEIKEIEITTKERMK